MAGLQEPPSESLWTEDGATLLSEDDVNMHEDGLIEMQGGVEAQQTMVSQTMAQPTADDESDSQITSGYGIRHERKKSQWLPRRLQRASPEKEAVRDAANLFHDSVLKVDEVAALVARLTSESHQALKADAQEVAEQAGAEATVALERSGALATMVPHDGFTSGIGFQLRRYIASKVLKAWTGRDAPMQPQDKLTIQKDKVTSQKANRIRATMDLLRDAASATERLEAAAIKLAPQQIHPAHDEQVEGEMTMPEEDGEAQIAAISSGIGIMRTSSSNWRGYLPADAAARSRTFATLAELFRDAASASEAVAAFVN